MVLPASQNLEQVGFLGVGRLEPFDAFENQDLTGRATGASARKRYRCQNLVADIEQIAALRSIDDLDPSGAASLEFYFRHATRCSEARPSEQPVPGASPGDSSAMRIGFQYVTWAIAHATARGRALPGLPRVAPRPPLLGATSCCRQGGLSVAAHVGSLARGSRWPPRARSTLWFFCSSRTTSEAASHGSGPRNLARGCSARLEFGQPVGRATALRHGRRR